LALQDAAAVAVIRKIFMLLQLQLQTRIMVIIEEWMVEYTGPLTMKKQSN